MFLSLSMQNFRSFKDETKLNFSVTTPKSHMPSHVSMLDNASIGALRSVGFYGANASGKSNALMALTAIQYLVCSSGDLRDGKNIPCYEPYRLCSDTIDAPIKFGVEFIIDGTRYVYNISFKKNEILNESLDYYPSRVKANLFTRKEGDSWQDIKFGNLYKGGTRKIAFFANNTYLSKAGNNASSPQIIRDVYNFFNDNIEFIRVGQWIGWNKYIDDLDMIEKASKIISCIDIGISKIIKVDADRELNLSQEIPDEIKDMIISENSFSFAHLSENGNEEIFKKSEESEGTGRFFDMIPMLVEAFRKQCVIVFDELDNNIHPHMADVIVRLFNDGEVNKYNSQLIFTTHNMQLMSPEKMRRDQLFFFEKRQGKSIGYSLNDFDKTRVKSTTPFGVWYDQGRFGGVPKINYPEIVTLLSGEKFIEQSTFDDLFGEYNDDEVKSDE